MTRSTCILKIIETVLNHWQITSLAFVSQRTAPVSSGGNLILKITFPAKNVKSNWFFNMFSIWINIDVSKDLSVKSRSITLQIHSKKRNWLYLHEDLLVLKISPYTKWYCYFFFFYQLLKANYLKLFQWIKIKWIETQHLMFSLPKIPL